MSRQENDEIKSLLMNAKVIKNKFTPLSFLVNVSKNVEKKIKDIECSLAPEIKVQPLDLIKQCAPTKKTLVKGIGSSKNRSTEQKAIGKEAIENFVSEHKGQNIMVFTDGSVKNRDSEGMPQTLGYGACASILIPVEIGRDVISNNKHVGLITINVECEVAGIELALNQIVQYIKDISINCYNKEIFIFCDCTSAIDIVCNQSDISSRVTELRNIWTNLSVIREKGITTEIIWCPGHCDIPYNDLADKEAKRSAENLLKKKIC